MQIKDVANQTGILVETIRYYEKIGLIDVKRMADNGYRIFTSRDVQVLGFIKRCRDLGFSLDDIRDLIGLASSPNRTCIEVKEIAQHQRAQIVQKQRALRRIAEALDQLIDTCPGDTSNDCTILASLFEVPHIDDLPSISGSNKATGHNL